MLKTLSGLLGPGATEALKRPLREACYALAPVKERSPFKAVAHCCTQKTASQWFRAVFSDPFFYRYTGLRVTPYVRLGLDVDPAPSALSQGRAAGHLYIGLPAYRQMRKPTRTRTFFVLRDPRDIVVSWYFSARYSHPPFKEIRELRNALGSLEEQAGLRHVTDALREWGLFRAQLSWMDATPEEARLFRYEDLAADGEAFLAELLDYLQVSMPGSEREELSDRLAFSRLSGGRAKGNEDVKSHYRRGTPGDWRRVFDEETTEYFRKVAGDVAERLGYEGY